MMGLDAPYVPGWDCHGLPIEHQVDKDLGPRKASMTPRQIRAACRTYAEKYVSIQREEFRRLGIFGEWRAPYLTMAPEYEGAIVPIAADLVAQVLALKGLRARGIVAEVKGRDLEGAATARSPFPFAANGASRLVLGEYVTRDTGTGAVHTAPGHGMDDFLTGRKYGLPIVSPVDDRV